ncbi:hypothetical protein M378DRAFT_79918 [Amanita muscaria Koide BX008]|uniref:Major facilitator superfamily (MFS) profile domain-containing protein n=1 Tax=Amanita muscaria (strain Koide BX008) TaxID=946122 RepID=A0A0C2WNN3_AMAMK|nr:hypothetical protein M378DRAFT_79918 [Amanita muscaria Koide BX008]
MSEVSSQEKGSTNQGSQDETEDKKLVWKVDLNLLPILTLLYLLSYLDRTSIGNAKYTSYRPDRSQDVHMAPDDYNTALAIFFVAYVAHEIPANVCNLRLFSFQSLKRFNPRVWLPSLTLVWSIVTIFQAFVTNRAGLFVIRYLLGAFEAGLFPGAVYVFSVYYTRRERSWRVSILFGGAALAGAFGGLLAYVLGLMDGIGGKRGWQWIFIVEGLLTAVVSVAGYFIVPTWSHKASFLTEDERTRLLNRLKADSDAGEKERFRRRYVLQAFADHLVWAYALLFHGFSFAQYSLSLFMPTLIANMGYQSWKAQLMTIPPNAAACILLWLTVWLSSRINMKAPFIIGSAVIARPIAQHLPFDAGYIILLTTKTAGAQYTGVHFAAIGIFTGNGLLLSWPSENVSGQTKRAVALAIQIAIGDLGAVSGVLVYRPSLSSNNYRTPHIIAIGYLIFGMFWAAYLWFWMGRANVERKRRLQNLDQIERERCRQVEMRQEQGDRNIYYRFVL